MPEFLGGVAGTGSGGRAVPGVEPGTAASGGIPGTVCAEAESIKLNQVARSATPTHDFAMFGSPNTRRGKGLSLTPR